MASVITIFFVFSALTLPQHFVQSQNALQNNSEKSNMLWEQYYGDLASRWVDSIEYIIQNSDGSYMLAASNNPKYYISSVMLIKVNATGAFEWSKRYQLFGPTGFTQTADNGYAIAGALENVNPDFPFTSLGTGDITLIKTNPYGDMQWNKSYPHNGFKTSMTKTSDGGFALAGTEKKTSSEFSDAWLLKTDSLGKVQWNTTVNGLWHYGELSQLIQTSDDGYAIIGHKDFDNGTYTSSGDGSLVVMKLDSSGKLLWNKTVNSGISNGGHKTIIQTSDDGYILTDATGPTQSPTAVKLDSAGDVTWSRTYATRGALDAVTQISDGGLVFAGNLPEFSGYGHIWIVKTDSAGNIEWNQTFGGQKYVQNGYRSQCIIQDQDGTLMVGGVWVKSESSADYYLAKIDASLPSPTPVPSPSLANPLSTISDSGNLALAVVLALIATAVTIALAAYITKKKAKN